VQDEEGAHIWNVFSKRVVLRVGRVDFSAEQPTVCQVLLILVVSMVVRYSLSGQATPRCVGGWEGKRTARDSIRYPEHIGHGQGKNHIVNVELRCPPF
jgi:hypothetical protein